MKSKKGVTLIIVLGLILIVAILANVALSIISSHIKFTHHRVSRIRAFYAAQAGAVYAFEKLRLGNDSTWIPAPGVTITKRLCSEVTCDVVDEDVPFLVTILIGPPGTGFNGTTPISATAAYSD